MRRIFLLASEFLLVALVSYGWATVYYADADNGNDSWDGTEQVHTTGSTGPFQTGFPNDMALNPGDQTLYKCGCTNMYTRRWYGGAANGGTGGVEGNPIIVGSYGTGFKPVLCLASPVNSGWNSIGGGLYTQAISGSTVAGFLEDRIPISEASNANCNDPGITGSQWYYNGATTLTYRPAVGTPSNHDLRIMASTASVGFYYINQYITIQDLVILGDYIDAAQTPITGQPTHDIIIQNCDFIGACFNGIYLQSANGLYGYNININHCTFNWCANNIYFVAQNNGSWNNCYVGYNTITNYNLMSGGALWQIRGDHDGLSIQNITNTTLEHNDISTPASYASGGITCWFSLGYEGIGNIIRYNYLHNLPCSGIIWGGTDTGTCNVQIYYNIVANVAGNGIKLNKIQTSCTPSGVYNNVAYNCAVSYYYLSGDYFILKNNISLNPSIAHVGLHSGILHNLIDYNDYYPITGNCFAWEALSANNTWAQWLANTGQETHSITGNSAFTNATGFYSAGTDFKITSSSPCFRAGTNVGLTQDFFGDPVGAVPDIGAYD